MPAATEAIEGVFPEFAKRVGRYFAIDLARINRGVPQILMLGYNRNMEHIFEIVSYVGAKPLLFGMTETQAQSVVGHPLKTSVNNLGERNSQYELFSVRYSPQNGTLVEVGFSSAAKVTIHGLELFRQPEAFPKFLREDSCPYEYFGFVILLDLGITLTGFHDNDPHQRAITAFERGRWDHLKGKFKKLNEPARQPKHP